MKKYFIYFFITCVISMALISQTIRVTSPNGGEEWVNGSSQDITWEAYDISNPFKISLWRNDSFIGIVADNLPPSARFYKWEHVGKYDRGNTVFGGSGYKIKVKEKNVRNSDFSNQPFTIKSTLILTIKAKANLSFPFTISEPTRGTVWLKGNTYMIRWTSENIPRSSKIGIKLNHANDPPYIITNNFSNQGQYKFSVPCTIPSRNRYMLTIYEKNHPEKKASVSVNIYEQRNVCLPDLVVCVTCGKMPKLQQKSTITFYVMNIGNKHSPPCQLKTNFWSKRSHKEHMVLHYIPSLPPFGTQKYKITRTHRWDTTGEKMIFAHIDPYDDPNYDKVDELNEGNNRVLTSYKVRLAGKAYGPFPCKLDQGRSLKTIYGEKCACSY